MDRIPFFEDERGMELSEYALTGALIAIAILAALAVISGAMWPHLAECQMCFLCKR